MKRTEIPGAKELREELTRVCKTYPRIWDACKAFDVDAARMSTFRLGKVAIPPKIAKKLGYELRWVKIKDQQS